LSEQSHKYAKYGIWATIVAALVGGGISLYTHFDSKGLKVEQIQSKEESKNQTQTSSVKIKDIHVTPVDFDIPSSFYLEIENGKHLKATDVSVLVDFGEAKIDKCSIKPNDQSNIKQNGDEYILKVKVNELLKNESIYINCLTSIPAFKKVLISGGNIGIDQELTYTSYKKQLEAEPSSGWYNFFSFLGGLFSIYIFLVVIRGINSMLGLRW
jgi:hypothetical protein